MTEAEQSILYIEARVPERQDKKHAIQERERNKRLRARSATNDTKRDRTSVA